MNLQPIIDEMRQVAKNHVFDINSTLTPKAILSACHRDITYRSYKIRITLTLDNLGERKIWHFSVNGIMNTLLESFMVMSDNSFNPMRKNK